MYINSLGTESSQNHLSMLKSSLNKCWDEKLWTLSFQIPCRMPFFEPWMQKSIILDEMFLTQVAQNRVKVATDGNIFEGRTFFEVPLKNFLLTS